MLRRTLVAASVLTAGLVVWWWHTRDAPTVPMPALPGDIATRDPIVGYKSGYDGAWLIVCQAREDTDGDGVIDVHEPGDPDLPKGHYGGGPLRWGPAGELH